MSTGDTLYASLKNYRSVLQGRTVTKIEHPIVHPDEALGPDEPTRAHHIRLHLDNGKSLDLYDSDGNTPSLRQT